MQRGFVLLALSTSASEAQLVFLSPSEILPNNYAPLKVGAICDSIHTLDCYGNDLSTFGTVTTHDACCAACEAYSGCTAWTWDWKNTGNCYLKSACDVQKTDDDSYHSGYSTSPSPSPTPPTPPTPTPPSPPSPPSPSPSGSAQISVVSYNLYWWCVSDEQGNCPQNADGQGFANLYEKVKEGAGGAFDLIGFQECDNIAQVLGGAGISTFDYYDGPSDAKMAWDRTKYTKISGPGTVWVASDQYGNRYMDWVRLQIISTGQTVFFANTHGPLNGCGTDLGTNYVNGINGNKQSTDTVVLTGDFNCGSSTAAITTVAGILNNAATGASFGGADHIMTSFGVNVEWEGYVDGTPSDHGVLKAVLGVTSLAANKTELDFVVV